MMTASERATKHFEPCERCEERASATPLCASDEPLCASCQHNFDLVCRLRHVADRNAHAEAALAAAVLQYETVAKLLAAVGALALTPAGERPSATEIHPSVEAVTRLVEERNILANQRSVLSRDMVQANEQLSIVQSRCTKLRDEKLSAEQRIATLESLCDDTTKQRDAYRSECREGGSAKQALYYLAERGRQERDKRDAAMACWVQEAEELREALSALLTALPRCTGCGDSCGLATSVRYPSGAFPEFVCSECVEQQPRAGTHDYELRYAQPARAAAKLIRRLVGLDVFAEPPPATAQTFGRTTRSGSDSRAVTEAVLERWRATPAARRNWVYGHIRGTAVVPLTMQEQNDAIDVLALVASQGATVARSDNRCAPGRTCRCGGEIATRVEGAFNSRTNTVEAAVTKEQCLACGTEYEVVFRPKGESSSRLVPRPVVRGFGAVIEERLRANDHKGGWKKEEWSWLLDQLRDEVHELAQACEGVPDAGDHASAAVEAHERVTREAGDVGAFAMMIADNWGAPGLDGGDEP